MGASCTSFSGSWKNKAREAQKASICMAHSFLQQSLVQNAVLTLHQPRRECGEHAAQGSFSGDTQDCSLDGPTWGPGPCWAVAGSGRSHSVQGSQLSPVGTRCLLLPGQSPSHFEAPPASSCVLIDIRNGTITAREKGTNHTHHSQSSELTLL